MIYSVEDRNSEKNDDNNSVCIQHHGEDRVTGVMVGTERFFPPSAVTSLSQVAREMPHRWQQTGSMVHWGSSQIKPQQMTQWKYATDNKCWQVTLWDFGNNLQWVAGELSIISPESRRLRKTKQKQCVKRNKNCVLRKESRRLKQNYRGEHLSHIFTHDRPPFSKSPPESFPKSTHPSRLFKFDFLSPQRLPGTFYPWLIFLPVIFPPEFLATQFGVFICIVFFLLFCKVYIL